MHHFVVLIDQVMGLLLVHADDEVADDVAAGGGNRACGAIPARIDNFAIVTKLQIDVDIINAVDGGRVQGSIAIALRSQFMSGEE